MYLNFEHINSGIDQCISWLEIASYLRGAEYMGCYTNLSDIELEILTDFQRIAQYESYFDTGGFYVKNSMLRHE